MFNLRGLLNTGVDLATNSQATKRWITKLPVENQSEAQKMIVNALHHFQTSKQPLNRERLKVLLQLDQSNQPLQEVLTEKYFDLRKSFKEGEKALWKGVMTPHWLLGRAYYAFIKHHLANRVGSQIGPYLPLITSRALHYFRLEIKWNYFHQQPIQASMWSRVHKLYRLSEWGKFERDEIKLNDGGKRINCRDEYVKILLLDLLNPVNLQSAQIETIDQWMGDWDELVDLEKTWLSSIHTHCIDLSHGAGSSRVTSENNHEKLRFWNMAEPLSAIRWVKNQVHDAIENMQDEPQEVAHLSQQLELLDLMARTWMRPAPKRVARASSVHQSPEMRQALYAVPA